MRQDGIAQRGSGATIVKGEFSDLFFSQTMQAKATTAGPADLAKVTATIFRIIKFLLMLFIPIRTPPLLQRLHYQKSKNKKREK